MSETQGGAAATGLLVPAGIGIGAWLGWPEHIRCRNYEGWQRALGPGSRLIVGSLLALMVMQEFAGFSAPIGFLCDR